MVDEQRVEQLPQADDEQSWQVNHYKKLYSEFEAQLVEITQKGGKFELVLNRRDVDGLNLEQRVMVELDRWRAASSRDAKFLSERDEKLRELEYLLFRIQGAVYTINGYPIPGENSFSPSLEGDLKVTVGCGQPIRAVHEEALESPEEMSSRLWEKYKHLNELNRRAAMANELDEAFFDSKGEKYNPTISDYRMGLLLSASTDEISYEGYRARGRSARKRAREKG
ncbi:hypothetical protein [uncultured Pseudodesulfovibrio sp.]|uniref:hypothetical protein n=1 Tax=uncultured Pseudodesulfovibrio sp. TaxID=2035858 RepID=UPI0029C883FB|nr:hypothetical protein [uncultured Pseudodesulfovibrio sp.]